jgi:chromosome segregation protein
MRLKSLELVGFKSFFDATRITFAPGVTAIVGPNGCGKSNIVDAIRWVLGEQAPGRLRARAAEDLIFGGSENRGQAGMAQVSMVLEADEGAPFPEPFARHSEVSVTRRLYRSGDSECMLNKLPCRLKDVSEFFMAAGIHSRAYAIIPQGKVEEIIQAKPLDLRALVEEAAGLALFKERRELSERKLARVKENLARVDQVLGEIERQLALVRRQAKKAETYRQLKAELEELERRCAARRIANARAELEQAAAVKARLKQDVEQARANRAKAAAAVERFHQQLSQLDQELAANAKESESLSHAVAERERMRQFLARRRAELEEMAPRVAARKSALAEKAAVSRQACAQLERELALAPAPDERGEAELSAAEAEFGCARAELERQESLTEQLRDELSEALREAAAVRSQIAELSRERQEVAQRAWEAERGLAVACAALQDAQAEVERTQAAIDQLRAEADQSEAEFVAAGERELAAQEALERHELTLAGAREALDAALRRARRLELDTAEERLRAVLDSLDGDRPASKPRFLADVIRAPLALEGALSAVLGELLSAVIVDSPRFALKAVEILREKQGGRLSFVPHDLAVGSNGASPTTPAGCRLLEMLAVDEDHVELAEALLGHVALADDVASALEASSNGQRGRIFVTRHGDVVRPGGIVSGGNRVELEAADTAEHVLSVAQAQQLLRQAEEERELLRQALAAARALRKQAELKLAQARQANAAARLAADAAQAAHARVQRERDLAGAHRNQTLRRLSEIDGVMPQLKARLEEIEAARKTHGQGLDQQKQALAEKRALADELGVKVQTLRSELKARIDRREALARELHQARLLAEQIAAQLADEERALVKMAADSEELAREADAISAHDQASRESAQALAAQAQRLRHEHDKMADELKRSCVALEHAESELSRLETEQVESGLRQERLLALCEELARSFLERFRLDYDQYCDELGQTGQIANASDDESRLADLRLRVERLGMVNLEAEGEITELAERVEKLQKERADLARASQDLTHTIQKLNREARRRFRETFEAAARNFAELLPKLMDGGEGRLELLGGSEEASEGLSVLVRPAGKRIKELGLLSGGEKAISALALIFSLFLLRPSPFCLLDEVDAALDERSLKAFTSLLGELKERSQFILATHNQTTMRAADQIHGVSMEQPGISQVFSLKFSQAA